MDAYFFLFSFFGFAQGIISGRIVLPLPRPDCIFHSLPWCFLFRFPFETRQLFGTRTTIIIISNNNNNSIYHVCAAYV